MPMSDFAIVRRSLTGRALSTVITVATVAVAVCLLLILLGLRGAAKSSFERGTGNATVLITQDASPLAAVLNSMFYASPPPASITWPQYRELADGFPFAFALPVQHGDSFNGHPVTATVPEFFVQFEPVQNQPFALAAGQVFNDNFQAVLGSAVAEQTAINIGDRIYLSHGGPRDPGAHPHDEFAFEIVGILEPSNSPHDRAVFINLDSSWILHAHDRLIKGLPADQQAATTATADDVTLDDQLITSIYAAPFTRPGQSSSAILPSILANLSRSGWTAAQPAQEVGRLFSIIGNIDGILLGMAWAVMISSGIAIMLALYNSMEQRRKQVAVLRVLGASRPRVFLLVITESAIIGLLGAIIGIAASFAGLSIASAELAERAGIVIAPGLPLDQTLVVAWSTVGLAIAAGLLPAIIAYRVSVVRSLRPTS